MAQSNIEWTDKVWNPVTGCNKVSAGCKNCYAETMFNRLSSMPNQKRYYGRKFSDVKCHDELLDVPLHWRKPQRIFVNSMSDLFHRDVPFEFINEVWETMGEAENHTFIILTKRPRRMLEYMTVVDTEPLPNVWLGVSVEDQLTADVHIPILLETPVAKRFVSIEPMLRRVDLYYTYKHDLRYDYLTGRYDGNDSIGNHLDWVILGGESGTKARQMILGWVRSVRDQCINAGVPFFFKQIKIAGKLVKMPKLDGKEWGEYPI